MYLVPLVVTGPVSTKVVVGELPISPPAVPLTEVAPVLVMPEPARTAKFEVRPRSTGFGDTANAALANASTIKVARTEIVKFNFDKFDLLF